MIIMITSIMIKTIKGGTSFNFLFKIEMDIIRYMLMSIIFFGIKYYSTDISGLLKKVILTIICIVS